MEDLYETLGVDRSATQEEIKKAYRKKAHQYHPDKDSGDEEKFKEVNNAYQVLGDEQKKSQYDQYGQTFDGAGGGDPFGGGANYGGFNINVDDIFSQFFGGNRGGQSTRGVRRGDDVGMDLTISLKESATGLTKEINHRIHQKCSHCNGNGAEPGTPIENCPTCGGKGTTSRTMQTPLGVFAQDTVCTTCKGEGKQAKTPCTTCRGEGRELKDRTLEVTIPAGIADGQTIRISDKGEVPPGGGVPGDLFITIHVQDEKNLERSGDNIVTNVEIPFTDAALGTTVTIDTLTGEQELTIPPGTQPGEVIRLSNQGFPSVQGGTTGDQLVTVNVTIPKKLSRKQKDLLKQLKSAKKGLFQ